MTLRPYGYGNNYNPRLYTVSPQFPVFYNPIRRVTTQGFVVAPMLIPGSPVRPPFLSSQIGTPGAPLIWSPSPVPSRTSSRQISQYSPSATQNTSITLVDSPSTPGTSLDYSYVTPKKPSRLPSDAADYSTPEVARKSSSNTSRNVDGFSRNFFDISPNPSKQQVTNYNFANDQNSMPTDELMEKIFDSYPDIRHVEFGLSTLSGPSAKSGELTFEPLKKLESLEAVTISNEYFWWDSKGNAFEKLCQVLAQLPNVKVLRLHNIKSDTAFDFEAEIIKHLVHLKHIVELDLKGSEFGNELGQYLPHMTALETLDLSNTNASAIASYLNEVAKLKIVHLDLSENTPKRQQFEEMSKNLRTFRPDVTIVK